MTPTEIKGKKKEIKSIIGIYPDGSRQSFSPDNFQEIRLQEFSGFEIVEMMSKEDIKKLYNINL